MDEKILSPGGLRPREASRYLQVSQRTLASWSKSGILIPLKVATGKRPIVLYPMATLERFLRGEK